MSPASLESHESCWTLVCEEGSRWSAALRFALLRSGRAEAARRVVSSDSPARLESLSDSSGPILLGLEVTSRNIGQRLAELARWRAAPLLCPVALLREPSADLAAVRRLTMILQEAGARQTIASPRSISSLVNVADRHAEQVWRRLGAILPAHELVWRRLPWQSPPWSIG